MVAKLHIFVTCIICTNYFCANALLQSNPIPSISSKDWQTLKNLYGSKRVIANENLFRKMQKMTRPQSHHRIIWKSPRARFKYNQLSQKDRDDAKFRSLIDFYDANPRFRQKRSLRQEQSNKAELKALLLKLIAALDDNKSQSFGSHSYQEKKLEGRSSQFQFSSTSNQQIKSKSDINHNNDEVEIVKPKKMHFCNLHGLWLSSVAGAAIELQPLKDGKIETKIFEVGSFKNPLITKRWTGEGVVSPNAHTTVTIIFQDNKGKDVTETERNNPAKIVRNPPKTAVFVGQCLVCDDSAVLQGSWMIFPKRQKCHVNTKEFFTPYQAEALLAESTHHADSMYLLRR